MVLVKESQRLRRKRRENVDPRSMKSIIQTTFDTKLEVGITFTV